MRVGGTDGSTGGGGSRKEGGGNKDFKKGWWQTASRGEHLKKGGAGTPLRTIKPVEFFDVIYLEDVIIQLFNLMFSLEDLIKC